jgi:hypothetical protein
MIPATEEGAEVSLGSEDLSDDEVDALLLSMLSEGSGEAPE